MNERAPTKLGAQGLALWKAVVSVYDLRADELRILEAACREQTLLAKMQKKLDASDLVVSGSMGQLVPHPLLSEVRQHRTALRSLLAQLKLPDDSGTQSRETKNRSAANQRWRRSG